MNSGKATHSDPAGGGLLYALGAHVIWGSMPLYLILVHEVPVIEFIAWRTLFTLPVCLLLVLATSAGRELRSVLKDRRTLAILFISASFVAMNWLIYVWAIQTGHVYAASLGYYILPLIMMLLGLMFLDETLTRLQWWAVGLAALGVGALAAGALTTLWVSLSLAITFGIYGLLRKTVKAGPLVGLTVEALLLLPLAGGYLLWTATSGQGTVIGRDALETTAIAMGGPMTAVPLLLFATAARRMPYSVIGFLQFISPTIVFVLGLTIFSEDLRPAQLACFIATWIAAALFTWGLFCGSSPAAGQTETSHAPAA